MSTNSTATNLLYELYINVFQLTNQNLTVTGEISLFFVQLQEFKSTFTLFLTELVPRFANLDGSAVDFVCFSRFTKK